QNVHDVFSRMAYSSVAKTAILPLQDVLALDETARINTPGAAAGNWGWRLHPGQLTSSTAEHILKELTWLFNRR
ncbi:MAG: malto-oligosyltrehalose synthase, partial [Adhaeribacter sp.]|nr:malto-oligosyltrehalose synthase [Adhaeribacter sp.]